MGPPHITAGGKTNGANGIGIIIPQDVHHVKRYRCGLVVLGTSYKVYKEIGPE
jgi:hypothetical protein